MMLIAMASRCNKSTTVINMHAASATRGHGQLQTSKVTGGTSLQNTGLSTLPVSVYCHHDDGPIVMMSHEVH